MSQATIDRWWSPILVLTVALATARRVDSIAVSIVVVVVLAAIAWWVSPLRHGRHVDHAVAHEQAGPDDVIVYWKPGCSVCVKVMWQLDDDVRDAITWVNIWADDEAAAHVRSLNDGDELTPTAVRGDGERLDRSAASLTEAVRHQP